VPPRSLVYDFTVIPNVPGQVGLDIIQVSPSGDSDFPAQFYAHGGPARYEFADSSYESGRPAMKRGGGGVDKWQPQ